MENKSRSYDIDVDNSWKGTSGYKTKSAILHRRDSKRAFEYNIQT